MRDDGTITPFSGRDVFVAATCYGKQSFENGAQAHRRLREMASKSKRKHKTRRGIRGVVYRCAVCRKWHIGGS